MSYLLTICIGVVCSWALFVAAFIMWSSFPHKPLATSEIEEAKIYGFAFAATTAIGAGSAVIFRVFRR